MEVIVETKYGKLRGIVADDVNTFKGIPYAAAPYGPNRFRPPQEVEPWAGVRDALAFGPRVPQLGFPPPLSALLPDNAVNGENCLSLNIWSPGSGAAGRPVMVWIHGGAFELGSSAVPFYDGSRFARDGIVCVTVNYRVGPDGFLY
ncbi:MAG: carboxylesterase family protein, partial [Desulfotomaculaceae bacterium]|nr:carboxylesterase family protein [Desulfotomaculaceae bacterium]